MWNVIGLLWLLGLLIYTIDWWLTGWRLCSEAGTVCLDGLEGNGCMGHSQSLLSMPQCCVWHSSSVCTMVLLGFIALWHYCYVSIATPLDLVEIRVSQEAMLFQDLVANVFPDLDEFLLRYRRDASERSLTCRFSTKCGHTWVHSLVSPCCLEIGM